MDGAATVDFDRIDTEADKVLPLSFNVAEDSKSFPTYAGAKVEKDYTATYADKPLAKETSVESEKKKIEYTARNLPAGAALDGTSGKFTWTPSVNQAGDHTLYITAQTPVSLRTIRVDIHVAKNLQAALDYVARVYDPAQRYESATEKAFKAALKLVTCRRCRRAAAGLELVQSALGGRQPGLPRGIHRPPNAESTAWRMTTPLAGAASGALTRTSRWISAIASRSKPTRSASSAGTVSRFGWRSPWSMDRMTASTGRC